MIEPTPPPIAAGTCPKCDTVASKHGCTMFRCYGPPSPAERDRRANAARIAYEARWTAFVAEHGAMLWRAAAQMERSPRLAGVIRTFISLGYLSPGEMRLVAAITLDLERRERRAA